MHEKIGCVFICEQKIVLITSLGNYCSGFSLITLVFPLTFLLSLPTRYLPSCMPLAASQTLHDDEEKISCSNE